MTIEHGKIDGDINLSYELVLHGMTTGNITVTKGGVLILHGMCCQNLMVEKDGHAYLHGLVAGNVLNRGGYLEVYGTVKGHVHTYEGDTFIDPEAVVVEGISESKAGLENED